MIQDCTFEFTSSPLQPLVPKESNFSSKECLAINSDLQRLLDKGVYSEHVPHDFISSIFGKPKSDGFFWLIFNLKGLNKHTASHHFKMESLKSVIQLMEKNYFMAPANLKDAYYVSISIHAQKYLHGKVKLFNLPSYGLSCATRMFTKLLKPA